MTLDEYAEFDAVGLADLVRRREVAASELAELAVSAIGAVNSKLNAVAETFPAFMPAATCGPLGGVPFLRHPLGGAGRATLEPHAARAERFNDVGFVTVGRVNGPIEPMAVRNPWNLARSACGAGAAVAAGVVPVAQAGGGPLLAAAGACGLVGLKWSWRGGSAGHAFGSWMFGGGSVLTRTVRDTSALLDHMQGSSGARVGGGPPPRLCIAVAGEAWPGPPMDSAVRARLAAVARLCEALGHHVVDDRLDFDAEALQAAQATVLSALAAWNAEDARWGARLDPAGSGELPTAVDLLKAEAVCLQVRRAAEVFFEGVDVLLTPTTPAPAGPIPDSGDRSWIGRIPALTQFIAPFSLTDQPAISLPLGEVGGLPMGMQFVGHVGEERLLLQLAGELENAAPWIYRKPPVWVGFSA
jgi:amidase